jgi:hypothetical protein
VENAKRLKRFIEEKRAYVQQAYKKRYGIEEAAVKFDIVAHSMKIGVTSCNMMLAWCSIGHGSSTPH